MEFLIDFFNSKERLSGRRLKILLYSLAFGLLVMFLFCGKSRVDLETIAISPDEQYIACFETGSGHKIRCFHSDGSLAFDFNIIPEISGGGYCTLWFDDNVLCVQFYRTDKIVYFAMDGTILNIADDKTEDDPPDFPSFSRKGHQYVFDGDEIDVVYDRGSFLGYWLFGAERYLAITPQNGEAIIVCAWTATDGFTINTN